MFHYIEVAVFEVFACKKQDSMDVAHSVAVDSKHIDMVTIPGGIDVDFGYGQPLFKEGKDCVLGTSELPFFIDRHSAHPSMFN